MRRLPSGSRLVVTPAGYDAGATQASRRRRGRRVTDAVRLVVGRGEAEHQVDRASAVAPGDDLDVALQAVVAEGGLGQSASAGGRAADGAD